MTTLIFSTLCFACAWSYVTEGYSTKQIVSAVITIIMLVALAAAMYISLAWALLVAVAGLVLSVFIPRLFKEKAQQAAIIGSLMFCFLMAYTLI